MDKRKLHIPFKELLLILLTAISLLIATTGLLVWNDMQVADGKFNQEARRLYDDLSRSAGDINAVLDGLVALHNAVEVVDSEQFSLYAREMLNSYPGIHEIKMLTKVEHEFKDEYIKQMREDGFPTFNILEGELNHYKSWSPTTHKKVYFPVTAIEPLLPEKIIEMGFDLYSEPKFAQAIDRAITTGNAASVTHVKLQNNESGYIVMKPIYAGRVLPTTEAERLSQALHLITVVVQSKDLLSRKNINTGMNVALYQNDDDKASYDTLITRFNNNAKSPDAFVFSQCSFNKILNNNGQSLMLSVSRGIGFEIIRAKIMSATVIVWSMFVFLILYIVNTNYARRIEREESLQAWQWEKERADVTLHSLADAVITTNLEGVVEYMNPVAERLTGWKIDEAKGRGIEDIFRLVNETDERNLICPVVECIKRGMLKESDDDISLVHRNGEYLSIDYSIAPMYGQKNMVLGAVLVFQDVGSSRMLSKLLSYQATHDDLTGLYNRREFERRMSRSVERVFKYNEHYILLYMDLDQFKVVNDTCGHVGGDLVLRQIAELVTPLIKERETLARLGGDEFGILLEGYTLEEAKKIANDILEAIRKYRFHWSGKIFEIGVSIGIVDIDSGMQSISNIMGYADAACYLAKDMSGNNVQVYQMEDADYKQRKDQMKWVQRITQAFADSRFILYAQKIVSLHDDVDEHYEILMRMLDDNGDIIFPQEYIIAAERYGSMQDIDRWVIRNAFIHINRYVARMQADDSLPTRDFAINLSGHTLSSNAAIDYVKELLLEYPAIIKYLVFEITETATISNLMSAQHFIKVFRSMGVKFSLDDFGTGVSSFNYLKNLNVDYLKIDGGFVREIMVDPVDYAMVKSIAHIGHVMGIKTIAEHAETLEVCDNLRDMGVDYAQGFCLHEPEELENLV